jgi:hypothetical protein
MVTALATSAGTSLAGTVSSAPGRSIGDDAGLRGPGIEPGARIGADDEVAVGIERATGPDQKIQPMMD